MLLDEPTSALDPKISREVMALIMKIAKEFNVPVLCNIHDVQLAMEFCNKIIGLQDGNKMFDGPTSEMGSGALERNLRAGSPLMSVAAQSDPRLAEILSAPVESKGPSIHDLWAGSSCWCSGA